MDKSPKKKKKLLLLTSNFPFSKGEEFLETEILYLIQQFDITIVPCAANIDFSSRCQVPDEVTINPDISKLLPIGWKDNCLWLMKHPLIIFDLCKIFFYNFDLVKFNVHLWKILLLFLLRSMQTTRSLSQQYLPNHFTIAYSYWLTPSAIAGGLLKKQGYVKYAVARTHGFDLYHERSPFGVLPSQRYTISVIDKIFCISEHGCKYLSSLYPEYTHKFELNRLGVLKASHRNIPSNDDYLRIVTCSYLVPVKRVELLIQALRHISFPVSWIHLGGGALETEMEKMAKSLPQNIRWKITGYLPNHDILHFYQENPVDLFINVSSSEGLPVSIMEALSYGIPVAATDTGGVSELVTPEKNGFLWPIEIDPVGISETLKQFHSMPDATKQTLRDNALRTWNKKVNSEIQYPRFTQYLLKMVS